MSLVLGVMPSSQFLKARRQGEIAQKYVAGMFRSWGLQVSETPRGYRPGFDQIVSGTLNKQSVRFKAEIKWDRMAAQTSNIYLDVNSLKKSQASILTICLNDPISEVLMLPLKDALDYAEAHTNVNGGEFGEASCLISKDLFIKELKPKILTTH
jgi:hypothetical protein